MATSLSNTKTRFFDKCGKPLSGGEIYTYKVGSTELKTTYADSKKTTPNTNPVQLDISGSAAIFLDGAYRVRVLSKSGVLIEDIPFTESWISESQKDDIYKSLGEVSSQLLGEINKKADTEYVDQQLLTVDHQLDLKAPQATTYTKTEVDSVLALKAPQSNTYTKAEVDTTFAAYVGGRKGYTTLALAQADQANLAANTVVEVTNDGANNGTYQWDGTTLTKSVHDPLTQSKNYTNALTGGSTPNLMVDAKITIDYQANTLSIEQGGFVGYGTSYIDNIPAQTIVYVPPSEIYPNAFRKVAINKTDKTLRIFNGIENVTSDYVLIGYFWRQKWYSNASVSQPIIANGAVKTDFADGFFSHDVKINIDFKNGQISVINNGYIFYNNKYGNVNSISNNTFDVTNPTYLRYLAYNKTTGKFSLVETLTGTYEADKVLLGYVFNYKFYGYGNNAQNINIFNANGLAVADDNVVNQFNEQSQRALIPNKLFFIEDRALPIYKDSVFSNPKTGLETVRAWIDTNHTETIKRYVPVLQQTILNPQDLSNTIKFVYAHASVADKRYWKNIAVGKAPQSKLARSFNMLCFGDSLTQVGTPWTLKNKLESLGATVTPVGTFWSTESPNELPSEGRGWWNYREFIGKDNESGGIVHTRSNGGKTRTAKFENPFLKLATAQDKADHPTWCFRFTGSQKELSYAEDVDKTGNFYIFDFDWYLTQHSVATPDFITIALSTNDINLDRSAYSRSEVMQFMQLGLEVMVNQIHKALPNVPIGVIPCPAWSATESGYTTFAADTATWVDLCFKKVAELKATHSNLEVVPVHLHMNRDMGYPVVNNVNLSADSDVQVGVISDWVHYDQVGRDQYADVVSAWLANSI